METFLDYLKSDSFNVNIFLPGNDDAIIANFSKFGKAFFPGNEILNPMTRESLEEEEKEEEILH